MVATSMMSAILATIILLEIKVFQSKGYEFIISVYDVNIKMLSHGSNHIVNRVVWPKLGYSGISMREVIITSIS